MGVGYNINLWSLTFDFVLKCRCDTEKRITTATK